MRVDPAWRSPLLVGSAAVACGMTGLLLGLFATSVAGTGGSHSVAAACGVAPFLAVAAVGALVGGGIVRWRAVVLLDRLGASFTSFRVSADATCESLRAERDRLEARNSDVRLVLDHLDQGLLLLERGGVPTGDRSAAMNRWFGAFGAFAPGEPFWKCLERFDPRAAASFKLNWEQLLEGNLLPELAIDQLPHVLSANGRDYQLQYTPLMDAGVFRRMLVVVCDVTDQRAAERAEAEQREVVRAFEYVMCDRTGFLEFFDEANSIVHRLCGATRPPLVDVRRWLHTLKGNAAVFGMRDLAAFCHELEDVMAEAHADLNEAQREGLRARWQAFASRISALLGAGEQKNLAIEHVEHDALLRALAEGRPRREIARRVAAWKLEPASERLARHAVHARVLAERLGKGAIDVSVESGDLRLAREVMLPFWTAFAHAVRNAVAHGLEAPEERAAAGKPPRGSIRLRASRSGERVTIEITDDGRGVNWEAVRAKARAAGVPAETRDDLHAALFHDGLSTNDGVDGVSGRGVGMGAIRAECEDLDGRVLVVSAWGDGTTIQFSFPSDIVAENDEMAHAMRVSILPSLAPGEPAPLSFRGDRRSQVD